MAARRLTILRRPAAFGAAGAVAWLMGQLVLVALVQVEHIPPGWAYPVQALTAIEANFGINAGYVWRIPRGTWRDAWLRFHATRLISIPLNQAIYLALLNFHTPYLLASVLVLAMNTVGNYLLADRVIFHPRPDAVPPP